MKSDLASVRQILMEGPLQLLDSGKAPEMFVILFDDMLLITRKKKSLTKKVSGGFHIFARPKGRPALGFVTGHMDVD
jgi:hypothetical protein